MSALFFADVVGRKCVQNLKLFAWRQRVYPKLALLGRYLANNRGASCVFSNDVDGQDGCGRLTDMAELTIAVRGVLSNRQGQTRVTLLQSLTQMSEVAHG